MPPRRQDCHLDNILAECVQYNGPKIRGSSDLTLFQQKLRDETVRIVSEGGSQISGPSYAEACSIVFRDMRVCLRLGVVGQLGVAHSARKTHNDYPATSAIVLRDWYRQIC
jgi:hypothetical protein